MRTVRKIGTLIKMADVSSYINQAPVERRAALETIRTLCRDLLDGYEESVEYEMPVYKKNSVIEVAFASQKQYISLYIMKKDVVDEHREALPGCSIGKGCIRFSRPDRIDFDVVASLLRRTVESNSEPC
jgi:uncharacterized protein YdhG (YjbR/CyaY superfamily)